MYSKARIDSASFAVALGKASLHRVKRHRCRSSFMILLNNCPKISLPIHIRIRNLRIKIQSHIQSFLSDRSKRSLNHLLIITFKNLPLIHNFRRKHFSDLIIDRLTFRLDVFCLAEIFNVVSPFTMKIISLIIFDT